MFSSPPGSPPGSPLGPPPGSPLGSPPGSPPRSPSRSLPQWECKVNNCRYKNTHSTKAHRCGFCNQYGHGQLECGNLAQINSLRNYYNEIIPMGIRCTINRCNYSEFHTKEAHHCTFCGARNTHSAFDCTASVGTHMNALRQMEHGIPAGGSAQATVDVYCPTCKSTPSKIMVDKDGNPDKMHKIFGATGVCIICFDDINAGQMFRQDCGHSDVCWKCAKTWKPSYFGI